MKTGLRTCVSYVTAVSDQYSDYHKLNLLWDKLVKSSPSVGLFAYFRGPALLQKVSSAERLIDVCNE